LSTGSRGIRQRAQHVPRIPPAWLFRCRQPGRRGSQALPHGLIGYGLRLNDPQGNARMLLLVDDAADDSADTVALGPSGARRSVRTLRAHARAVERTNCQIVLLANEGRHALEIAWLVRRGDDQVRKVLHRFQREGVVGLAPRTTSTPVAWSRSPPRSG